MILRLAPDNAGNQNRRLNNPLIAGILESLKADGWRCDEHGSPTKYISKKAEKLARSWRCMIEYMEADREHEPSDDLLDRMDELWNGMIPEHQQKWLELNYKE